MQLGETHPTLVEVLRWDFLPAATFLEPCMFQNHSIRGQCEHILIPVLLKPIWKAKILIHPENLCWGASNASVCICEGCFTCASQSGQEVMRSGYFWGPATPVWANWGRRDVGCRICGYLQDTSTAKRTQPEREDETEDREAESSGCQRTIFLIHQKSDCI